MVTDAAINAAQVEVEHQLLGKIRGKTHFFRH